MVNNVIAKVQLVKGHLGYYDELSGIYLTHANPIAEIKAGTNCSVLRASAKEGKIRVIEGTLSQKINLASIFGRKKRAIDKKEEAIVNTKAIEKNKTEEETVPDKVTIEATREPKDSEEKQETVAEKQAPVEEKPKKKTRKKTAKVKEAPIEE